MSRSVKAHILLILVVFIWGSTFVVIKEALKDASPLVFNAVRFLLATFCLAAFYPRELKRLTGRDFKYAAPVGVFLFLGYTFQTTGLRLTTPSKSGFITGVSVVLVPLFLFVFFRKRLRFLSATGAVLAFGGLALLALPAGTDWRGLIHLNRGDLLTLGCAVAFAFHIIFIGRATEKISFQAVAIVQTAVAAILMWIAVPIAEHPHFVASPRVMIAVVLGAVLATAVAFSVQSWAQQFTSPTNTALIFALEPVFALLTSYVVLHERLGSRAAIGCALILAGVLISEVIPEPALKTSPSTS
ncbi:MAG TPA: DMT family transporter [Terriglobales bacterium]